MGPLEQYGMSNEGIAAINKVKNDLNKAIQLIETENNRLKQTVTTVGGSIGYVSEKINPELENVSRQIRTAQENIKTLADKLDKLAERYQAAIKDRILDMQKSK